MSDEAATPAPTSAPPKKRRAPTRAAKSPEVIEAAPAVSGDGADEQDGVDKAESAAERFGAFVPVEVVDVVITLPNPNPVLLLKTTDAPERTIAIPIGAAEGISIANALRGVSTPKPLTHELFAETLTTLGAWIAVARITAVEGGAFYAEIVVGGGSHGQQSIACRPSDAVAMALRQRPPAPIVTSSGVLEAVGSETVAER
jgi:uncharacterized protein